MMSFLQLATEKKTSFLVGISNKFRPFLFCRSFSFKIATEIFNRKSLNFNQKLNFDCQYHKNIYPWPYLGVQNSSSIPSKQSFRQSQISNWGTQRPLSQETPLGQASCFARASSCNKTQKNRLVFEIRSCVVS